MATALLVALATTTSVFAQFGGTQSSATNAGPLNTGGSVAPAAITPGQAASYTSTYSFTVASAQAGQTNAAANTTIGTMYQQWRHNALPDRWFYLYAGNQNVTSGNTGNAAQLSGNASFAYYYYTREAGQTQFTSNQAGAGTTGQGFVASPQAGVTGVIYLDTARTFPIATVRSFNATVVPGCTQTTPGTRCSATFETNVRWGLPQEAWPTGSATLLQAVTSVPLAASPTGAAGAPVAPGTTGAVTYFDAWNFPVTLTLNDTAPAQSATGVTNLGTTASPGARNVNVNYQITQTGTDANGDLQTLSLVFVFQSGTEMGQWFQIGYVNGDDNDDDIAVGTGRFFYRSAFEDTSTATIGSSITGRYVNTASVGAAPTCNTATTGTAGGTGCSSESVTYSINFSSQARGTVNVFGNVGDFHGASSGNVLVGSLTIS